MSYCVAADISVLNPTRTYSATSTPSLVQLAEYISQIAGEIDTVLEGRGLTVPVTSPDQFVVFLKQLNVLGAGAMAERAMFPEAQGMMGGTSAAALHWKQYQDGLKFLKEGNLPTGTSAEALPFSFFEQNTGATEEPSDDNSWARPKFGKNKDF